MVLGRNKPKMSSNNRLLARPRMDLLLYEGISYPLVTVVAGTGYGKSNAVLTFLSEEDISLGWMKLSKYDNVTSRFWRNVIDAISSISEEAAEELIKLGFPSSLPKFEEFLHIIAREIYSGEPLVFALDDFENITNPDILQFVENVLLSSLENFCVILISKNRISLNISELYKTGSVFEITDKELCFTPEEIKQLFAICDVEITDEQSEYMMEQTEGWPLAVHLSAVDIRKRKNHNDFFNLTASSLGRIVQVFDIAFFSDYPDEIKKVLVKMSFLEGTHISVLKNIYSGDLQKLIDELDENLFIRFNPASGLYTFHNLFNDFLRNKEDILEPEQILEVYNYSAQWHEQQDRWVGAVIYYFKAQVYDKAFTQIRKNINRKMTRDMANFAYEYLEKFPDWFVNETPVIYAMKAGLKFNNMQIDEAKQEFLQILEEWEKKPLTEPVKRLLGESCVVLGEISMVSTSTDFSYYYKKAVEYIPDGSWFRGRHFMFIENNDVLFLNSNKSGVLEAVENEFFTAMPYAEQVLNGCAYGLEYLFTAEAAYNTYEINKAYVNVYKALYKSKEKQQHDIYCNALWILMKLNVLEGDLNKMTSTRDKIGKWIEENKVTDLYFLRDCAYGWFYAVLNDSKKIARWIIDDTLLHQMPPMSVGRDRIIHAYYLLCEQRYEELLELADQLKPFYTKRGIWCGMLDLHILCAISCLKLGSPEKSYSCFKRAYDMVYANGIITPFIEKGAAMRAMLKSIERFFGDDIDHKWVERVYTESTIYGKHVSNVAEEYFSNNKIIASQKVELSKREHEILVNLSEGMTREEISILHRISVNTVKSIIKRIYNKLGAVNRSDAVYIAIKRGLI